MPSGNSASDLESALNATAVESSLSATSVSIPFSKRNVLHRWGLTRRNLRASTADGATYGVMVGAGETYIAAFALAVGLGEVAAGLVSSVPLMVGGILQMISLRAVHWVGSEKRWIVLCAAMQGLAFLPLVAAAIYGSVSLGALLLIASVYWAGGLASGPAWNTWIESIVPRPVRPKYFARRSRLAQLTTLVGLVGGGFFLQWAQATDRALVGFATIFGVAGVFRMWSVYWLASHVTPPSREASTTQRLTKGGQSSSATNRSGEVSGTAKDADRWHVSGVRLLAYLVVVQGMVQISGPYFASYMLEELSLSYGSFVSLLAMSFLAKVTALTWWVKVAHRGGARMLLWIGGLGIVPLSSLWIVSTDFYWLAFVQVLSGTLWAAYELGFFLMFFEALPVQQRIRMLTMYNLANTTAWCCGALVGAGLLHYWGVNQTGYYILFGVSSLGRLSALSLLVGAGFKSVPAFRLAVRVLGVRPASAGVDTPILPSMEAEEAAVVAEHGTVPAEKRPPAVAA